MHPVACRLAEDAAADREAAADGMRRGALERGAQLRFGRVEPEQQDAVAVRVVFRDGGFDVRPGGCGRRFELPPRGRYAEMIEAAQRTCDRVLVDAVPAAAGDDFEQQFATERGGIAPQLDDPLLLREPQLGRIVRMIEDEALDHVARRPGEQRQAAVVARLELERP